MELYDFLNIIFIYMQINLILLIILYIYENIQLYIAYW